MPSLFELSARSFGALEEQVSLEFDDLNDLIAPLRTELDEQQLLIQYDNVASTPGSIVTVDGACVVQQLAGLDLINICAVAAEGLHGEKVFDNPDNAPKYHWGGAVRDHISSVGRVATTAMSLQEMMLLEDAQVQDHQLRIIDGSWSSALLSVSMDIQRDARSSAILNRVMFDMYEQYGEGVFETVHAAIARRIRPWLHAVNSTDTEASVMIAVSKSDSQRAYQTYLSGLELQHVPSESIGDRNLAGLLLNPGEMLPVVESVFNRPAEGRRSDDRTLLGGERALLNAPIAQQEALKPFYELIRDVIDVRTGSIANAEDVRRVQDEKWLHATYFKPVHSGEHARPIRVEFVRPQDITPDMDDFNERLNQYARVNIVKALSHDITPQAQEPMSQYFADRAAKAISVVSKLYRERIIASTTNEQLRAAMINEYRT